jgi:lipopolysaccharide biosynthesis glycosyltransferase
MVATGVVLPIPIPPGVRAKHGRDIMLARLFIPLLFSADWFLYFDDDLIFKRGEFFPEVMSFTSDSFKVMFAVQDHLFVISRGFQERIRSYNPTFPGLWYYGSGFLLMRSGLILRRELRSTLAYIRAHPRLEYIDQDALNLGFNFSYVHFLPDRFCVLSNRHIQLRHVGYAFHYNGAMKSAFSGFGFAIAASYRAARARWLAFGKNPLQCQGRME